MIGAADHRRILAAAEQWRDAPLALATVIKTWRSAPCPVGTHMLIHQDGRFTGSVSGGCVEGDILQCGAEVIATSTPILRRYGVANAQAWEAGLPCGGDIEVLVQPVSATGFPAELFDTIIAAQAEGRQLLVGTDIGTGGSRLVEAVAEAPFVNLYAPPRRLLIVGAVEIAVNLANLAQTMGVAVTVIDPRSHFLTAERFPSAGRDDRWPDDAIAAHKPDSRTAVVTLSHDPKIDDPALIAALASPARYIAALGSRASHKARCERLAARGIGPDEMARIEGPAGVAINAINAPEIALSIAAGIIRAFNDGLR
jgi:xanthine dehydrogenase accessory factor